MSLAESEIVKNRIDWSVFTGYDDKDLREGGIYRIRNTINNKCYYGSATNTFRNRWRSHYKNLLENNHHCQHLQRSYNKHGKEKFVFEIVETIYKNEIKDNRYITDIEQMYLDFADKKELYNTSPTAGSSKGVKHCSKQIENNSKKQYLVISPENETFYTNNLSEFCRNNIQK